MWTALRPFAEANGGDDGVKGHGAFNDVKGLAEKRDGPSEMMGPPEAPRMKMSGR